MVASGQRARVERLTRSARARRLAARAPRYLFVCFLAVTCVVGVREILVPDRAPLAPTPPVGVDHAAHDLALRFARAYLAHDAARPDARERALSPLVPRDLGPDAGFLGERGRRDVLWAHVAASEPTPGGGLRVVVAARTDVDPHPLHLAVPIDRVRGRIRIAGHPALVGPPAVARGELPTREEVDDPELVALAQRVVTNYLAGERANLAADLLPRARVSLPGQQLRTREVIDVAWADGRGSGALVATVEATDGSGGLYTLAYELGVEVRRGRAHVSFVGTAPAGA